MTRKEDLIVDQSNFQCPSCQVTRDIETKRNLKRPRTIEELLGLDDDLINEDLLRFDKTQENTDNVKQTDSTVLRNTLNAENSYTVEITHKQEEESKTCGVAKTDSEYVSLNIHLLQRAKSEGGIKNKKRKPNCHFGRMEKDNEKVILRPRTKSAETYRTRTHDPHGISESTVFFSPIGEWTIIDLNLQVFEKEDAKRTVYLRRKGASYKEVEPESICRIL